MRVYSITSKTIVDGMWHFSYIIFCWLLFSSCFGRHKATQTTNNMRTRLSPKCYSGATAHICFGILFSFLFAFGRAERIDAGVIHSHTLIRYYMTWLMRYYNSCKCYVVCDCMAMAAVCIVTKQTNKQHAATHYTFYLSRSINLWVHIRFYVCCFTNCVVAARVSGAMLHQRQCHSVTDASCVQTYGRAIAQY